MIRGLSSWDIVTKGREEAKTEQNKTKLSSLINLIFEHLPRILMNLPIQEIRRERGHSFGDSLVCQCHLSRGKDMLNAEEMLMNKQAIRI